MLFWKSNKVIILALFCTLSIQSLGQIITQNDGFEGPPQIHIPPDGWVNCHLHNSTVDTQPGIFNNQKPPSQGNSYISMVTRETDVLPSFESAWSKLVLPFEQGKCYTLKIDLSLSKEFMAKQFADEIYFDKPCKFQIFGFNANCSHYLSAELLWETDTLTNYDWETFEVFIQPELMDVGKLLLRPYYLDEEDRTYSVVFVDNLSYKNTPNVIQENDFSYTLPDWAEDIEWYFNGTLLEGENGHSVPLLLDGLYEARFYDESGCLIMTSEYLTFDHDAIEIYPNPTKEELMIKFFGEKGEQLYVVMHDAIGKKVFEHHSIIPEFGNNFTKLSLVHLAPGTYTIQINRGNQKVDFSKIVIHQ